VTYHELLAQQVVHLTKSAISYVRPTTTEAEDEKQRWRPLNLKHVSQLVHMFVMKFKLFYLSFGAQVLQNTSDQGYWDMHLVTFNDTSYFV